MNLIERLLDPDRYVDAVDEAIDRIQSLESELKRKDEALKIAINVFEKMMEASISYRIMPFVAKQALAKIKEVLG